MDTFVFHTLLHSGGEVASVLHGSAWPLRSKTFKCICHDCHTFWHNGI